MATYKYIVVPRDAHSNEVIATNLAQTCSLIGNETTFSVDNKEKQGYYVTHQFITRLKNNRDPRVKVEFYEQEGNNPIKKYSIPGKKPSKKLREVRKQLKNLPLKK